MTAWTLTRLENRDTPSGGFVASGAGVGSRPLVQLYRPDGSTRSQFFAFDPAFTGGVNVALADVNADGVDDVVAAAGPGGGPHVKVFDGVSVDRLFDPTVPSPAVVIPLTELYSFFAYDAGFSGGVSVAAADVDADGRADVVTGAGPGGGPHVKAFSGANGGVIRNFFAFDIAFRGGVNVAAGRVNSDVSADIVVGSGPGTRTTVSGYDGQSGVQFFTLTPFGEFTGGASVATAKLGTSAFEHVIVGAGRGGGPRVAAFDGSVLSSLPIFALPVGGLAPSRSFFAFDLPFSGGVSVAATDVTGDGIEDIIAGAGPGGDPRLRAFNGAFVGGVPIYDVLKFGFVSGTPEYTSGVTVGA
jgi:hypothetical protein